MCTTFAVNGSRLFGQNYDFYFGHGYLFFNPRGLQKFTLTKPPQQPLTWRSRYSSITFNQFGCEFPIGGMNEAGLTAAIMFDEDGSFPPREAGSSLNELQWLQYQLDNFATVAEVKEHLSRSIPYAEFMPLHYSLADRNGRSLTVEFTDGKPVLHEFGTFHVLTNNNLEKTIAVPQAKSEEEITEERDISVKRFKILTDILTHARPDEADVGQAFGWLDKISFKNKPHEIGYRWFSRSDAPSYTFWSIVYDIKNLTVYFKTLGHPAVKTIALRDAAALYRGTAMLDMDTAQTGDVTASFVPFDTALNRLLIERSYLPMVPDLSEAFIDLLSTYPTKFAQTPPASV
jgi:choloylglycine hydrolase family protein